MTFQELEQRIALKLPDDYRQFLEAHTESLLPTSQVFSLSEKTPFGESGVLDELNTLGSFANNGIRLFEDVRMLVIGDNLFGYPTCLCLKYPRHGHVFYFDIQQRSLWQDEQFYSMFENLAETVKDYLRMRSAQQLPRKEAGLESFYHVADSFSEFQGLLRDEETPA